MKNIRRYNRNESIEIVEDNSEVDILNQLAKEVTDINPDLSLQMMEILIFQSKNLIVMV